MNLSAQINAAKEQLFADGHHLLAEQLETSSLIDDEVMLNVTKAYIAAGKRGFGLMEALKEAVLASR